MFTHWEDVYDRDRYDRKPKNILIDNFGILEMNAKHVIQSEK
jgi:hypothetical protein